MSLSFSSEGPFSAMLRWSHSWFTRQFDDRKPKGAIASLDGVRAMAFLLVLLLHVSLMTLRLGLWQLGTNAFLAAFLMAGSSGVTLFFVLSGFLLFLPYSQALLFKKAWPSAKIFYMRRILRIFPAYFFSLFLLVFFSKPFLLQPHNWTTLLPFLTFTMDFSNSAIINGPYWTLATEFQYYLLLPLIALGIAGLARLVRAERRVWVVVGSLLAMMAWGIGTRWWGEAFVVVPHALINKVLIVVYGVNGKFFEDFAVGMLLAIFYTALNNSTNVAYYLRRMQRFTPWFILLGLAIYAFAAMRNYTMAWNYTWSFAPQFFQIYPWITEWLFALSYGCLILAVLFNRPGGLLRSMFEWTPLRWIGLLSYSLYIWHEPLLLALQDNLGPTLVHMNHIVAIGLSWGLVFCVSVFFCFFTYLLIEKPGMQLSERLRQRMMLQRVPNRDKPKTSPLSVPDELRSEGETVARSGAGSGE